MNLGVIILGICIIALIICVIILKVKGNINCGNYSSYENDDDSGYYYLEDYE